MTTSEVVKDGIILSIKGITARVEINCGAAACSACRLSMLCGGGKDHTVVDATIDGEANVAVGDKVVVTGRIRGWLGSWILLAGLPCLAILAGLAIGTFADLREGLTGVISLGLLIGYYVMIWCFRKRINRRAEWSILATESSDESH